MSNAATIISDAEMLGLHGFHDFVDAIATMFTRGLVSDDFNAEALGREFWLASGGSVAGDIRVDGGLIAESLAAASVAAEISAEVLSVGAGGTEVRARSVAAGGMAIGSAAVAGQAAVSGGASCGGEIEIAGDLAVSGLLVCSEVECESVECGGSIDVSGHASVGVAVVSGEVVAASVTAGSASIASVAGEVSVPSASIASLVVGSLDIETSLSVGALTAGGTSVANTAAFFGGISLTGSITKATGGNAISVTGGGSVNLGSASVTVSPPGRFLGRATSASVAAYAGSVSGLGNKYATVYGGSYSSSSPGTRWRVAPDVGEAGEFGSLMLASGLNLQMIELKYLG